MKGTGTQRLQRISSCYLLTSSPLPFPLHSRPVSFHSAERSDPRDEGTEWEKNGRRHRDEIIMASVNP